MLEAGRVPLDKFGNSIFKGFPSMAHELNISVPSSADISSAEASSAEASSWSSGIGTSSSANFQISERVEKDNDSVSIPKARRKKKKKKR